MKHQRDTDAGGNAGVANGGEELTWRDYLAIFVAAVETVGLPLLVFIVVVLIVVALSRFVR